MKRIASGQLSRILSGRRVMRPGRLLVNRTPSQQLTSPVMPFRLNAGHSNPSHRASEDGMAAEALLSPVSIDLLPSGDVLLDTANRVRNAHCLGLLTADPSLSRAAYLHAYELVRTGRFTHDGIDGSSPYVRVDRIEPGWALVSENLATGHYSPDEAFEAWLKSRGHRRNLLRPGVDLTGGALLKLPNRPGFMCVQLYGSRHALPTSD